MSDPISMALGFHENDFHVEVRFHDFEKERVLRFARSTGRINQCEFLGFPPRRLRLMSITVSHDVSQPLPWTVLFHFRTKNGPSAPGLLEIFDGDETYMLCKLYGLEDFNTSLFPSDPLVDITTPEDNRRVYTLKNKERS